MSLLPTLGPTRSCATTQHVFVTASCTDLLSPPSASFSSVAKLVADLGQSTEPCYHVQIMLDDFACPERCSEVLTELDLPLDSVVECSSSSAQMNQSEHDEWMAGYSNLSAPLAMQHQKYPSPKLRPDFLSALDAVTRDPEASPVWVFEMDVALPGGNWANLLGRYQSSPVDFLAGSVFECGPGMCDTDFVTALANYTSSTNTTAMRASIYANRYSAALVQELIEVRSRGFYSHEEVFIPTVARGANFTMELFDVNDTSPLLWSWTSSCAPLHYARELVFANVLGEMRSNATTDKSMRKALTDDIEGRRADLLLAKPEAFGRLTHPFKWDALADDAAFEAYVAKASDFACEWAGIGPTPNIRSATGTTSTWHQMLANETLAAACNNETLELKCNHSDA